MIPEEFDEIMLVIEYLKRRAEDVYGQRDTWPHFVEMDVVVNELSRAEGCVRRAKEGLEQVMRLDQERRKE